MSGDENDYYDIEDLPRCFACGRTLDEYNQCPRCDYTDDDEDGGWMTHSNEDNSLWEDDAEPKP